MRATPGLHVEWVDDEAVVLDPLSGQLHYLNPAAALFYALVQENGFDQALDRFQTDYPEDSPLREGMGQMVDEMKEKGLLVDD